MTLLSEKDPVSGTFITLSTQRKLEAQGYTTREEVTAAILAGVDLCERSKHSKPFRLLGAYARDRVYAWAGQPTPPKRSDILADVDKAIYSMALDLGVKGRSLELLGWRAAHGRACTGDCEAHFGIGRQRLLVLWAKAEAETLRRFIQKDRE